MKTETPLRRALRARGLSMRAASRLGIPYLTIVQHCNGSRKISAESAIRYARSLGIPLSELRPDLWRQEAHAAEGQQPPQEAQDA